MKTKRAKKLLNLALKKDWQIWWNIQNNKRTLIQLNKILI